MEYWWLTWLEPLLHHSKTRVSTLFNRMWLLSVPIDTIVPTTIITPPPPLPTPPFETVSLNLPASPRKWELSKFPPMAERGIEPPWARSMAPSRWRCACCWSVTFWLSFEDYVLFLLLYQILHGFSFVVLPLALLY